MPPMAQVEVESQPNRHVSELSEARERFLARVVDQALSDGFRTPDDFLRHFPPQALVESLAANDALRVKLLVAATGMHDKIAKKKSIPSAAEDLGLALEEGTTDSATILSLYPPDDRVRHLPAEKLWAFAMEDEFWKVTSGDPDHQRSASRLTFLLECALDENLITLRDMADGMTFQEIASCIPPEELQEVVKHALQIARADAPLTEERLLAVVPLKSLVSYLPLRHTFERVVIEKVAGPCQLVDAAMAVEESELSSAGAEPEVAGPSPAPSPPPPSAPPKVQSDRPPEEDDARRRVKERLEGIGRLPPSAEDLSTPVLLSIESMYADLAAATDEDEREAAIRDAFPNETLLRQAMLALIPLLDSTIDTTDPVIAEAEVDGLIKIVLFEERRRAEPARPSAPGTSTPPSSAKRSRRSVPPPLPKSAPPPLPDEPPARAKR